ncbi:heparin lyase I family protein [Ruegeria atlantica]|uniref:heparin lyase I family protein n=1 Tax=Ruegeria atlantica TaxID=81569 RepID=UPI00147FA707|nr:heparin lyase I family protein [Ruegeria atlantica]
MREGIIASVLMAALTLGVVDTVEAETIIRNVKSGQSPREVVGRGFRDFVRETWVPARSYGAQIVADPPGNLNGKAVRMELRYGDCGREKKWDDCARNNERVEFAKYDAFKHGQRKKYQWYVYFAPGFSDTGAQQIIVTQFSMMGANSHPFQFAVRGNKLIALKRVESTDWNYESLVRTIIPAGNLTGRWHKINVDAKWSTNDDGHFIVWVNDAAVYQWTGRTLGDGTVGKFKLGMYRNKVRSSAPPVVLYFAGIKGN